MQDRRKACVFLVTAMFVSSSVALLPSVDSTHPENSGSTPHHSKVLIIGAGASGVAAAARLMENGILDVTLLEAEGRIGGRTNSVPFGNNDVVDLGAQWVSGVEGNVVYQMAKPLGLLEEGTSFQNLSNMQYLQANGTIPDQILLNRLLNFSFSILENPEVMLNHSGSVGDYFMEKYTDKTSNPAYTLNGNASVLKDFLPWAEKLFAFADGADSWWILSAKGMNESWECAGEQGIDWINNGYSSVIDLLTKRYPNPAQELPVRNKTLLRTEVKTIHWGPNAVDGPNGGKLVLVETSDGGRYTADYVIITVSLGVLKERASTLFNPQLPERKLNTIRNFGFGQVDKLFLHFNETWWPGNIIGYSIIASDEDRARFNQLYPQYREKGEWATGLSGFYMVPRRPKHVLYDWIVGEPARNMEKYSDEDVKNACMRWLEMFIGHPLPEPTAFTRSKWYSNPHFRGSYTHRSLDSEKYNARPAHLAEPLLGKSGNPEVLFAGEATHDHYYGYVHGAIETGWREADRILDLLRKEKASAP